MIRGYLLILILLITGRNAMARLREPPSIRALANTCADNPQDITVSVVLQINFSGGETETCADEGKNEIVGRAIQTALNNKFATSVPDWNGKAEFQEFRFEESEKSSEGDDGGYCPATSIQCTADYCETGCLTAATTDCGTSVLTNWINLEKTLQETLAGMQFSCLGIADQLQVILVVDDPDLEPGSRTSVLRNENTELDPSVVGLSLGPLLGHNQEDEAAADAVTKDLRVQSNLTFTFFEGTGALPQVPDMATAMHEIVRFYSNQFQASEKFAGAFQEFHISDLHPRYEESSSPDQFLLVFLATVVVNNDAEVESRDAADVMGAAPYKEFIGEYARGHGGVFENTFKVMFRGVTRGNRRELVHAKLPYAVAADGILD